MFALIDMWALLTVMLLDVLDAFKYNNNWT